jgi:uncharacterized protein (UPF0212 family)
MATMITSKLEAGAGRVVRGLVHCPICTRTVEASVVLVGRRSRVQPRQRCPRCGSALDAAWVINYEQAA